ncbi:maltose alpha-D-glucosyltransferase [Sphaerothrix gracilis]|uniref:maltose alpha-D-glucosyltransferase n=1 Tax=Sphaerothrix gracilis TaxID=3151835 RepID=UPI0031FC146C
MTYAQPIQLLDNDPLWFKQAVIYEVPVRAFADSNADGIGDLAGLTSKLEYLQDLGVTALWLLPFFPSPLKDDGYDISDYKSVNPDYGTLADFKTLLEEAHQRGIRIIVELIVNHTSDQHAWFQRARRSPKGSVERDFYVWSDTPQKYEEARIIFQDFETSNWSWDPIAQAYYWHRFYSHQPDLNYDNPAVRQAVFEVLDFWLEMGVDGLRMDAVPYLYEREGTNCENLPETHEFLKALRKRVDERYPNRMLLAEANQWPEDAAAYYGEGDECHMNFHFPLMPRLFMALRMEDNFPIIDILQQTPEIPDNCQWGIFLRNHDELTLEMVTDEDRDYMYRVYAQDPDMRINLGIRRRLSPLLGNDRRQIELLNSLLLSLPGTPVLYYGDEIGMGENIYLGDRNGVRTPMQWSPDRNAGFSKCPPQKLYLPLVIDSEYHYEAVNVEAQRSNTHSLWYTIKRLLATRKRFGAFGLGTFELLHPDNRKVLAFIRRYKDECILVVANLSRFLQTVRLDLSEFEGQVPTEIHGTTEFPSIDKNLYFLSVGPYACYWFTLKFPADRLQTLRRQETPTIALSLPWQQALQQRELEAPLEAALTEYLHTYRGFTARIQTLHIAEVLPIPDASREALMVWLHVEPIEGEQRTYLVLMSQESGDEAMQMLAADPQMVIARLQSPAAADRGDTDEVSIIFDAMAPDSGRSEPVMQAIYTSLLQAIAQKRTSQGRAGNLITTTTDQFPNLSAEQLAKLHCVPLSETQRNTCIVYNELLLLKLFRRQEEGTNPDLEIRRFLAEKHYAQHVDLLAGALEYHRPNRGTIAVGLLQTYAPDVRNFWSYTLDVLRDFFEQVLSQRETNPAVPVPEGTLLELQNQEFPTLANENFGPYLSNIYALGESTADLHLVLASDADNPHFAPEPFTTLYQRSVYQSARNLTGQTFRALSQKADTLPETLQPVARAIAAQQDTVIDLFRAILDTKVTAKRIRCHGDYHLGQILHTGLDFIIIDFEGDSTLPLNERRIKRSPLRDVAEMLQSLGYAAESAFQHQVESGMLNPDQLGYIQQWQHFWLRWVSASFLKGYLNKASSASFLPETEEELHVLLKIYLLERIIYSLSRQLDKPDYDFGVTVALNEVLQTLQLPEFASHD